MGSSKLERVMIRKLPLERNRRTMTSATVSRIALFEVDSSSMLCHSVAATSAGIQNWLLGSSCSSNRPKIREDKMNDFSCINEAPYTHS
jgi:hypothetical protein